MDHGEQVRCEVTAAESRCDREVCTLAPRVRYSGAMCRLTIVAWVLLGLGGCDAAEPDQPTLTNRDPSCLQGTTMGAVGNQPAGLDRPFMVAARLTPAAYPATVTAIRYWLAPKNWGDRVTHCDTAIPHRFEVHVGAAAAPASNPTVLQTQSVTAPRQDAEQAQVRRALTAPLTLQQDQHLFVVVEVAADTQRKTSLCVAYCQGLGLESFSSGDAVKPPYLWQSFKDKGYGADLVITAELE
jgi:hypothetical protein